MLIVTVVIPETLVVESFCSRQVVRKLNTKHFQNVQYVIERMVNYHRLRKYLGKFYTHIFFSAKNSWIEVQCNCSNHI